MKYDIHRMDCVPGAKKLFKDNSVDLVICDPPFGINESNFDVHYNRNIDDIIEGYQEAPNDYYTFSYNWLKEAYRILKNDGSMYLISGWSNLVHVLNALQNNKFNVINHIIWRYPFSVYTKNKFMSSHYHIIYASKSNKVKPYFNRFCRFGPSEKDVKGNSYLYNDLRDVWEINKESCTNAKKNQNKLPSELLKKMILYSSKENDIVCDFFMGNFTTAYISIQLGRTPIGFELNENAYNYHIEKLNDLEFGSELKSLKIVDKTVPKNQGKTIEKTERENILNDFIDLNKNMGKKNSIKVLSKKYERGYYSISNILKGLPKNPLKPQSEIKSDISFKNFF